ncbi:uncharacterized protein PRCAT00003799001 [Priceomyces carsonii]|uniref:uncharacterized protein n=1 Tax=Priceomyces carsonii TaxID=28549 RepID=UPI002ED8D6A6|nr:unnamed protein product [Priceomyces carsonii]
MSTTVKDDTKKNISNLKVVILGDLGVGKTCLRSQFVHHIFTNAYKSTIGGDYLTSTVRVTQRDNASGATEDTTVNLQVWDTAGQERFNSISQTFYRGTDVVILVYDVTNFESVLSLRDWFHRFLEHCHVEQPGVMIVGNKTDKTNERCVDMEEIREILTSNVENSVDGYVLDWELDLKEVSSKNLDLVEGVFIRVAEIGLELAKDDPGTSRRRMVSFDDVYLTENQCRSPTSKCFC